MRGIIRLIGIDCQEDKTVSKSKRVDVISSEEAIDGDSSFIDKRLIIDHVLID